MDSPWNSSQAAAFAAAAPNERVLTFARTLSETKGKLTVLDLGCGAGRNAVPLALAGHKVLGIDNSPAMLEAAVQKAVKAGLKLGPDFDLDFREADMEATGAQNAAYDLLIAQGIWNLAQNDAQFFRALQEASRAAKPGAGLFVFTFSRDTLPPEALPLAGQRFTYSGLNGSPQIFLSPKELFEVLDQVGFNPAEPLKEYNRPPQNKAGLPKFRIGGIPLILEGTWIRRS